MRCRVGLWSTVIVMVSDGGKESDGYSSQNHEVKNNRHRKAKWKVLKTRKCSELVSKSHEILENALDDDIPFVLDTLYRISASLIGPLVKCKIWWERMKIRHKYSVLVNHTKQKSKIQSREDTKIETTWRVSLPEDEIHSRKNLCRFLNQVFGEIGKLPQSACNFSFLQPAGKTKLTPMIERIQSFFCIQIVGGQKLEKWNTVVSICRQMGALRMTIRRSQVLKRGIQYYILYSVKCQKYYFLFTYTTHSPNLHHYFQLCTIFSLIKTRKLHTMAGNC